MVNLQDPSAPSAPRIQKASAKRMPCLVRPLACCVGCCRYLESVTSCSRKAQLGSCIAIGAGTSIGDDCNISRCVIGRGCVIGKGCNLHGCYIQVRGVLTGTLTYISGMAVASWISQLSLYTSPACCMLQSSRASFAAEPPLCPFRPLGTGIRRDFLQDNVVLGDKVTASHALLCGGVTVHSGAVLQPGVVLSYGVVVGAKHTVPGLTTITLCKQLQSQVRFHISTHNECGFDLCRLCSRLEHTLSMGCIHWFNVSVDA